MRTTVKIGLLFFFLCLLSPMCSSAKVSEDRFAPLKRFSQVMDLVENNYVKDVTRGELIDGAIVGMLQQLDPHSSFLTKDEFKEMQVSTSGAFGGVGIEITAENGRLVVISPIEDTPADKAGVRAGDVILEIDGVTTQDMTLMDAVKKIRGPKGEAVRLTILHKNAQKPVRVNIVRDTIPIVSAKKTELDNGYLLIRLTRFNENTTEELQDILSEYTKSGKQIKGVILDLRNNPGGLLDQAVNVSDTFLSKGAIVTIKGKQGDQNKRYEASSSSDDVTAPMIVLINAGSASASEIVAGALQDQGRALLLGEKTFGKGSVQTVIPLTDGSGIKLTTALYYTPSGRSIQAEGIEPDFEVPLQEIEGSDTYSSLRFREKDLSRHLENSNKGKKGHDKDEKEKAQELLERDNQLKLALELVKQAPVLTKSKVKKNKYQ
ncbi:S41 family peptidase [Desulfovibrio inopinatus]|uniref:S41 family peptidase n=1 Tax=Desulfovibrio inopinatus TaxID=102109 RepID=UPI00048866A4|nr:S41 family peptidase [Desulfovibrio inopinatus]